MGVGGSEELTEIMSKNNSNTAKFGIMLASPSAAGQSHEKKNILRMMLAMYHHKNHVKFDQIKT